MKIEEWKKKKKWVSIEGVVDDDDDDGDVVSVKWLRRKTWMNM